MVVLGFIRHILRTTAGLKRARRRGIQLGRKRGLDKVAKQKAILATTYYKENNLPIVDILKLVGIKSKPAEILLLVYYLYSDNTSFITGGDYFIDEGFTGLNS